MNNWTPAERIAYEDALGPEPTKALVFAPNAEPRDVRVAPYPTLPMRHLAKTRQLLRHLFRLLWWRLSTFKVRRLMEKAR